VVSNHSADSLTMERSLQVLSGLLENMVDARSLQLDLFNRGLISGCLNVWTRFHNKQDVCEALFTTMQNVFAFQPEITRKVLREFIEMIPAANSRREETLTVVNVLNVSIFDTALETNPKLATAVVGAYLALVQPDIEASKEAFKHVVVKTLILQRLKELREKHRNDRTFVETVDELKTLLTRVIVSIMQEKRSNA
jgi:hypothetical protein